MWPDDEVEWSLVLNSLSDKIYELLIDKYGQIRCTRSVIIAEEMKGRKATGFINSFLLVCWCLTRQKPHKTLCSHEDALVLI